MLDLSASTRTVAGVDIAGDSDDPLRFYALPPQPRLAQRDGAPCIQLLRLVQDGKCTGGHLQLSLEASHSDQKLKAVQAELEATLKRKPVTVSTLSFKQAKAQLNFIGRESTDAGGVTALLKRPYGETAAFQTPPHTAFFSISLTPDGVRLVEAAMRSGGAPVGVTYFFELEGLWPAMRVLARIDWGRAYDHFSMQVKEGYLFAVSDIQRITENLIESKDIQIQVVRGLATAPAASADVEAAALAWIQRELVEKFCEPALPLNREPAHASLGTLGEIFGVGYSFAAKKLTQIERAVAEIDFQQKRVVTRTLTSQSHLADLLGGADPGQQISDATLSHPFFQRFNLAVHPAQPLASVFLKEAVLQIGYGREHGSIRLTPDISEGLFECWADAAADRTWQARPDVAFAEGAPLDAGKRVSLEALSGQDRSLTLDFKRLLGLKRVEIRATLDPRVALTQVTVTHTRGGTQLGQSDLALAPQAAAPQIAWFRDYRPGDVLEANGQYLLADGRIVKIPPIGVKTEIVRLPDAFPGVLTVQLIADDDWKGIDQVAVTVQKSSDAAAGAFVFDKPGATLAVNLDMPDPADRTFRYRMTRTLSTGVEETDDWVTTDTAVVVVGKTSANRLIVDVTPIGPELPQAGIRLIQVDLSYIDAAHQVRNEKTVAIAAKADRPRWEVDIQDPNLREYEYRVTVFRLSSSQPQVGHWQTSTDRVLAIPVVASR